jgi:GTP cyclohydrolase III
VISGILGRISPGAIEKYLKVDVEMLRQCALNPQEALENAELA